MRRITILSVFFLSFLSVIPLYSGGSQEAASSSTRGRYLAGQGLIIPPGEIFPESYIASIDYSYPEPEEELGLFVHTGTRQVSALGSEGIIHLGIQGETLPYGELPPMNLSFVIDTSSSMNEEDKIEWVKEAFGIFINKVRDKDFVSLVEFNDKSRVIFPSTRMDTREKRDQFLEAVNSLKPQGGSDLEEGLGTGYEQVLSNFRESYINRVLFMSDGTEFSARLAREGAKSGDIRISLLWNNRNDLDLHVITPGGEEIYYGTPEDSTGGMLDVDMNVQGESIKPVENIYWSSGRAAAGTYRVYANHYSFHEEKSHPYQFQVEVKNGDEYSHFEGTVGKPGENTQVEVTEFIYKTDRSKREEKNVLYQLAGSYREMGIHISTIGVGVGFDVELMRNLAKEGGGSSRFMADREEMEKIFGSEFDRMVVPAAFDLSLEVELLSGAQVIDTWGYNHSIQGNRISYFLPTLHLRDYETILIKYRTPALTENLSGGEELPLAGIDLSYKDLAGSLKSIPPGRVSLEISPSAEPVAGISDGMVLQSGTILNFAEGIMKIGAIYYEAADLMMFDDGSDPDFMLKYNSKLLEARALTMELKGELENASMRLDDQEIFEDHINILDNYISTIEGEVDSSFLIPPETEGPEKGGLLGGDTEELTARLSGLFREMSLAFTPENSGTAALLGFTSGQEIDPAFLSFINETAGMVFADSENIKLVERDKLDEIISEQNLSMSGIMDTDSAIEIGELLTSEYIITGTVIPAGTKTIVFGRIINVETGEIVNAAQIFLEG